MSRIVRVVAVTDEDDAQVRERLVDLPKGVDAAVVVTPVGTLVTLGMRHSSYLGRRHHAIRDLEQHMSQLIGR